MLPILAVIAGVAASAFTIQNRVTTNPVHSVKATTYYWFVTPYNGANYQGLQTKPDEITATGCDGSITECQKGFAQNQLVNGDPSQGVISSQQSKPASEIFVHQ